MAGALSAALASVVRTAWDAVSGAAGRRRSPAAAVSTVMAWNANDKAPDLVLSNGDVTAFNSTGNKAAVRSTTTRVGASGGKFYFEATASAPAATCTVGVMNAGGTLVNGSYPGGSSGEVSYQANGAIVGNLGSTLATVATYASGDIIGVAVDLTGGKIYFAKNGVWLNGGDPTAGTGGIALSTVSARTYAAACAVTGGGAYTVNLGGAAFVEAVPTGYGAWG